MEEIGVSWSPILAAGMSSYLFTFRLSDLCIYRTFSLHPIPSSSHHPLITSSTPPILQFVLGLPR